ncbi:MAG: hypothetical protein RLZZ214_4358 [Verrucomicrobiota bacterium]|jgi:predicted NBD/HSP70 family sugar kinase
MNILVIDVGGTNVKVRATSHEGLLKIPSGPKLTAARMVEAVRAGIAGWEYEVITIGYPGLVVHGNIASDPHNLGAGWVGFDFKNALEHPVKIINDAAMQALGSYQGGRMLFLGLGTGMGAAMIVDGVLVPMELAHLPYRKRRTYEDYVGLAGLERMGKSKWTKHVKNIVKLLKNAMEADDVVLGGGNAELLKELPEGARLGDNANAFTGGCRLWDKDFSQVKPAVTLETPQ